MNGSEKLSLLKASQVDVSERAVLAGLPTIKVTSDSTNKEHTEQGQVKRDVYLRYIEAASMVGFSLYLLVLLLQQVCSIVGNLVLKSWGEHNRRSGDNSETGRFLLAYGLAALATVILGASGTIILLIFISLRSARKLHDSVRFIHKAEEIIDKLSKKNDVLDASCGSARPSELLRADTHWAVGGPLILSAVVVNGLSFRIMNLFSRDIYVVDQVLAQVGFQLTLQSNP